MTIAGNESVDVMVDLMPEALGIERPASQVELRLHSAGRTWSAFLRSTPEGREGTAAWISRYAPLRLEAQSGRVLRADFAELPHAWMPLVDVVRLQSLTLRPDGPASVLVRGRREDVQTFVREVQSTGVSPAIRNVRPSVPARALLTAPQYEALRAAEEIGYYRIPRPVNLRMVAKRLGASAASLSERLRRAEAKVIRHYLEEEGDMLVGRDDPSPRSN